MFGIRKGKANKVANIAVLLYKSILHPHLEYSVQFWALKKGREELEKVQRRAGKCSEKSNRMNKGVTQLLYKEQCRRVGLLKLEKRWDGGHCTWKAMKSLITQREWIAIKCWLWLQDNEGPAMKLLGAKFKANKRKKFVLQRRSFPKHTGIARSLQALPSIWRGPCHRQTTAGSGNPLSWK